MLVEKLIDEGTKVFLKPIQFKVRGALAIGHELLQSILYIFYSLLQLIVELLKILQLFIVVVGFVRRGFRDTQSSRLVLSQHEAMLVNKVHGW